MKKNYNAFTLAEVLITLGIIGIVAAMTLPALINNYRKTVTVNQLKVAYSIMAQALTMAQKDYGDMTLEQINDPVDTVTEAGNVLSVIGLPISNRYKKKLKKRGITSVLKKGTKCIVTPYLSYADIPYD